MILRIVLYAAVLGAILYLTAPHLASSLRQYQGAKNNPKHTPLTLKLLWSVFMTFVVLTFVASYLILLSFLAAVVSQEIRDSWWYVAAVVCLFAVGTIIPAYYIRDWWVSFRAEMDRPSSVSIALDDSIIQDVFDKIIGNTRDAVIVIDLDTVIVSANYGLSLLFGYSPDEVKGQRVEMLLPEQYREKHASYIAAFVASGEKTREMGARREVTGRHKNGGEFKVAISISKTEPVAGVMMLMAIIRPA